jgi:hypothetical protein
MGFGAWTRRFLPGVPFLFALLVVASAGFADTSENMTPLLLAVQDAPVPFMGSDGRSTWFTSWP